jgi:hypothetical protein
MSSTFDHTDRGTREIRVRPADGRMGPVREIIGLSDATLYMRPGPDDGVP